LKIDLSSLPLGTLRKAQRALVHAKSIGDSEDDSSMQGASDVKGLEARDIDLKGKQKEKPEWSTKPRTDLVKRSNKHA